MALMFYALDSRGVAPRRTPLSLSGAEAMKLPTCAVASGSWGGRCPSLGGHITGMRAHGRGDRCRRVLRVAYAEELVAHHQHSAEDMDSSTRRDGRVYIVSIPGDWFPPGPGVFVKKPMNNLADLGEKMGADPSSWSTNPP